MADKAQPHNTTGRSGGCNQTPDGVDNTPAVRQEMERTMSFAPPAIFPQELPEGFAGTAVIAPDWIMVENTIGYYVGCNVFEVPGFEQAFGSDLRRVMQTRKPLTVRRLWNAGVWEDAIRPHRGGGIKVDYVCVHKITPLSLLTLKHFFESVNLVSEALLAGDQSQHGQPSGESRRSVGRQGHASPLRAVPVPE